MSDQENGRRRGFRAWLVEPYMQVRLGLMFLLVHPRVRNFSCSNLKNRFYMELPSQGGLQVPGIEDLA